MLSKKKDDFNDVNVQGTIVMCVDSDDSGFGCDENTPYYDMIPMMESKMHKCDIVLLIFFIWLYVRN